MANSKPLERTTIKIPSESTRKNWKIDAWQYLPNGSKPFPVIVMAHGFGATKNMSLDVYAEAFTGAGYACVVFDYRNWGASDGTPRHLLSIAQQLADYRSVIKYCRQQDVFDPQRIVAWGTSFSGGHAISIASERGANLTAAIAQCPFVGGSPVSMFTFAYIKIVLAVFLDILKQSIGLSPFYIPTVARPGELGALTSSDAVEGLMSLTKSEGDFPNQISASSMLSVPFYSPLSRANEIKCPILLIPARNDTLCSAEKALKVSEEAEKGECEMTPGGHFEVYLGGRYHEMSLKAQLTFLKKHVPN